MSKETSPENKRSIWWDIALVAGFLAVAAVGVEFLDEV